MNVDRSRNITKILLMTPRKYYRRLQNVLDCVLSFKTSRNDGWHVVSMLMRYALTTSATLKLAKVEQSTVTKRVGRGLNV